MTDPQPGTPVVQGVTRFRKRPVEVSAIQWTGANLAEVQEFTGRGYFDAVDPQDRSDDPDMTAMIFDKLHSTWVHVYDGQWIIRGIQGEFYPITDDVLALTYEPADGPDERDQITELEHRIGQAAEEAESMALEGGVARACALRFLGALQVPEAEWPAAPATGPLVLPPDEFAAAMRAVAAALGYRAEAVTIDSAAPGTQAPAPASPGPATAATDAAGGILVPDRETLREAVSAAIDAGWWSQGPAPSERVMQIVWPLLADRGRAEGAIVHAALDRATERLRAAEGKLAEMTADLRALAEGCADLASNGRDLDRNCTASSAYRDVASDITAIIGTGGDEGNG